jgi:hypothetical protein
MRRSRCSSSPAYPFLIAAYGALWAAGRRVGAVERTGWVRSAATVAVAAGVAFLISNLSWFAFSGHFVDRALGDYVAATLPQAPHYIGWAVAYGLLGMMADHRLQAPSTAREATTA